MAAWRRWGGAAWPRWDGCRRWGPWQTGRAALVERQGGALAGSGRRGRWRRGGGGGAQHGLDGTDAGDGVLGKREGHCYRPDEFAVDVDRAPAHALHDAGVFQRSAGEAGEDEGFLGADIVEHAQDFDLEVLDFVPVKDGAPGAVHPGFEVLEREQ